MEKPVLNKAKSWGFPAKLSEENHWQISPALSEETNIPLLLVGRILKLIASKFDYDFRV